MANRGCDANTVFGFGAASLDRRPAVAQEVRADVRSRYQPRPWQKEKATGGERRALRGAKVVLLIGTADGQRSGRRQSL
jgi:hypothetical protein